jgi:hypothetical protein
MLRDSAHWQAVGQCPNRTWIPPLWLSWWGTQEHKPIDLSFEIDLWGRLPRATESARTALLASEEARRTAVTTLVSDVTTAYFQLRELDPEWEISKRRLESRRASFRLVQARAQVALTASAGLGPTGVDGTFFGPKGWSP